MNSLVLLALVAILVPTVSSLRCNSCLSTTSDLDCYQNRINEDCQLGTEHRCARASYRKFGQKKYYRGCMPLKHCNAVEYCKTTEAKKECTTDCCNGDLCNSSVRKVVSGAVMTACVLVAFLLHA